MVYSDIFFICRQWGHPDLRSRGESQYPLPAHHRQSTDSVWALTQTGAQSIETAPPAGHCLQAQPAATTTSCDVSVQTAPSCGQDDKQGPFRHTANWNSRSQIKYLKRTFTGLLRLTDRSSELTTEVTDTHMSVTSFFFSFCHYWERDTLSSSSQSSILLTNKPTPTDLTDEKETLRKASRSQYL